LNWYDYGFRNYDPQIGRFTQLDPLTDDYPYLTPYQYASCDPITNIDIDGLEGGSAVGAVLGGIGKGLVEAAEHGGVVKDLTGIVVKASYAVSKATKALSFALSAGNFIEIARLAISMINSNPTVRQVGNRGAIFRNNQRYNHHSNGSGNYGNGRERSSEANHGIVFTSEFGGGNNGRHGQTDEASVNADFIMAVTSSWMGGDPEFVKNWMEIIEKIPDILIKGNEMIETYKDLKQKKAIEDYIKREYPGGTTAPVKFQENSNSSPKIKTNIPETPVKSKPYKRYFNGKPAPNEKGKGQATRSMPPESGIPDTIFFPNPKRN